MIVLQLIMLLAVICFFYILVQGLNLLFLMLKYKVMEWNMENGFILIKLKAERVKIIGNWNERNLLTMLSSFFSSVVREIAKEKDLNEDEALDFVIGCVREAHWKL